MEWKNTWRELEQTPRHVPSIVPMSVPCVWQPKGPWDSPNAKDL